MHWFSRIETPPVPAVSIAAWKLFARDLDLGEASERRFRSLNTCFTRRLKPGARTIDPAPDVLVSPCDAIVGASGRVQDARAIQAKGLAYSIEDLLGDAELARKHEDGLYVTLRLTGSMYHHFHAPCDGRFDGVTYVSGDTWNVNPIALAKIERLFCRNERVVLPLRIAPPSIELTLVPVAAVLVACIRLLALPEALDLAYEGPVKIPCAAAFAKGDELGWFEQGSTILVFASGPVEIAPNAIQGTRIRMGEPLLRVLPHV
jgi:phosphatidylserine decarboxylase